MPMCPGWMGVARVIDITEVGRMTSAAAAKSSPWFCRQVLSATGSAFRLPDFSYIQLFAQPVECLSCQAACIQAWLRQESRFPGPSEALPSRLESPRQFALIGFALP